MPKPQAAPAASGPDAGGAAPENNQPGSDQDQPGEGAPGDGKDPVSGDQPTDDGGRPKAGADDGSGDGRSSARPRPLVRDLHRLRQQNRQWEERFNSLEQKFNETLEQLRRGGGGGASAPKKGFWDGPEEFIAEQIKRAFEEFGGNFTNRFDKTLSARDERAQKERQVDQAIELIASSMPDLTDEDQEDIADIIDEKGLAKLGPLMAAEVALVVWQKERGITNKAPLRRRASQPGGTPPAPGGKKTWTVAEIEDKINREGLTPELEKELRLADQEGRIRE